MLTSGINCKKKKSTTTNKLMVQVVHNNKGNKDSAFLAK